MVEKIPNLFIVGFPKAGTTSMHVYLSKHPQIFMSRFKEPAFFDTDWKNNDSDMIYNSYIFKTIDKYLSLFPSDNYYKYYGESSTVYIYSNSAYRNIYKYNRKSKIIIMIREPISMIISNFKQFRVSGVEHRNDINSVFNEEIKRIEIGLNTKYISRGFMFKHIKKFVELFDKNNVKIIVFDDFIADPKQTYLDVLDFLGLKYLYLPRFINYNKTKDVRTSFIRRLLRRTKIGNYIFRINNSLYYFLSEIIDLLTSKNSNKNYVLNNNIYNDLKNIYKKDIKKTSRLINIDLLNKWGYDD